jgi:predicted ATPase
MLTLPMFSCNDASSNPSFVDLNSIMLHGRAPEMMEMDKMLKSLSTERGSKVFLLEGSAGSGKTELLSHFRQRAKAFHVSYGMGSFEYRKCMSNQPQTAIGQSFQELLVQLEGSNDWDSNVQKLKQRSESHFQLLQSYLPILRSEEQKQHEEISSPCLIPTRNVTTPTLQAAFRTLLNVIATPHSPLMLIWDNIESADLESIQFIEALTTNQESNHILIVLSYREERGYNPCQSIISTIESPWSFHKSNLADLSKVDISSFLSMKFDMQGDELVSLVDYVLRNTCGNRYHMKLLLSQLETKEKSLRKTTEGTWVWDHKENNESMQHADSLSHLLLESLQGLDDQSLRFLQIAAFLGNYINPKLVMDVISINLLDWNQGQEIIAEDVQRILNLASTEAIIDNHSNDTYCFSHSSILDLLINMIPNDDKTRIHNSIGRSSYIFYQQDKEANFPNSVFIAADHLKHAQLFVDLNKIDMVSLNTDAANRAMSMGAFLPAGKYLDQALQYMGGMDWANQYQLTLSIFNMMMTIQHRSYQLDHCKTTLTFILNNAKSLEDKQGAYDTLISLLETKWETQQIIDLCFSVLDELGEKIPRKKSKLQFGMEMMKVKKRFSQMSDTAVILLPKLQNGSLNCIISKFLGILSRHASYLHNRDILEVTVMREIQLFLNHGASEYTPSALAHFGMLFALSGEHKNAFRMGELAIKMTDIIGTQSSHAQTYCIVCKHCLHWGRKLEELVAPLSRAYRAAYEHEEIEASLQSAVLMMSASLLSGRHLFELEEEARTLAQNMSVYKTHENSLMTLKLLWQGILNIHNISEDPVTLTGEVMQQGSVWEIFSKKGHILGHSLMLTLRLQLACYFKKWDIALEAIEELSGFESFNLGSFQLTVIKFFECLTYFAIDRQSPKSRKYQKNVKKIIQQLKSYVDGGVSWCEPYVDLLEAEEASFHRQKCGLKKFYDTAIKSAETRELRHISALANECASTALRQEDGYLSHQYIANAHEYYYLWGAMGKVIRLEAEHKSLESKPTMVSSVTSSRGSRTNSTTKRSKGSRLSRGSNPSSKASDPSRRSSNLSHRSGNLSTSTTAKGCSLNVVASSKKDSIALM